MNIQRLLQVKCVKKLCRKYTDNKRGYKWYEPCYKFDYIWKCLVQNVIVLTEDAGLDLRGDETRYVTASYGGAGAGLTGRVKNKPGSTK